MSKIKSLLLQNFKQFSDVSVEFKDGINLVVGQNGEGKSNMMEAIEICLNYIQADQSIMSRNQNVSHTYIGLKTTDFDIKFALTGDKKQFFLNDKLITQQALEMQQPCNLISIKQLQAYKLATFNGQQLFQYFQNKATLQNYQQKMDSIQQQLKEIKQKREQSQSLIEDFKASIIVLNEQVGQYQEYKDLKKMIDQIQYLLEQIQLESLDSEIYELREQLKEEENQKQIADDDQKQTLLQIQNLNETITQKNNDLLSQQVTLQNITSIYKRLQQSPDFRDIGDVQTIQAEISRCDEELQITQQKLDEYQFLLFKAQLQQDKGNQLSAEQKAELRDSTQKLTNDLAELSAKIQTGEKDCSYLRNKITGLKANLPSNQGSKLTDLLVQLDTSRRECQKAEQNLQKVYENLYQCYSKNQYTIMEEIRKLSESEKLPGFIGFFGELITTDPNMYIVLEQSGGHLLNQAVVDTTENAMKLIKIIQDKSRAQPELCGCRMNILVLDQFEESRAVISYSSQVQSQNNAQQFSSLINVKNDCQNVQKVIYHYFDRVLVVDSFDLANQLAESYQCDCYTVHGDSVLRSGLINAGNHGSVKVQRFHAVIQAKKQVLNVKQEIEDLDRRIQSAQSEQSEITSRRQKLQQLQNELHSAESELNVLKTRHSDVSKEVSRNQFLLDSTDESEGRATDASKDDAAALKQKSDALMTSCTTLQEKRFQLQQKLQNVQELQALVVEMEQQSIDLQLGAVNHQNVCVGVTNFLQNRHNDESIIQDQIQKMEMEKQEMERKATQLGVKLDAWNENIQLLSENLVNKQNLLGKLQRNATLLSTQLNSNNLPDDLMNNKDNKNYLQQRLQQLNAQIQELGDQNVVLYENVEEKQKQLTDVESDFQKFCKAENQISVLLKEVEEKHKNELESNFHLVSARFSEIFKCLTDKEGKLLLDVGKKELTFDLDRKYGGQVSMQQLSGGQQTLVSLTLILALAALDNYHIYLLDEVDSNLDRDVKISFYNMLQQIVEQSGAQVIISSFRSEIIPFITGNIIEVKNGSLRVLDGPDEIEDGVLRSTEIQQ